MGYGNLDAFLAAIATLGLTPGGVGFNPLSPAFDGWFWCTLLYLLHGQGVAIVDVAGTGTADLAGAIDAVAPRTTCMSPSMYAACPDDLPSVDVVVIAGEASPPTLARRFAGRRVLNVYGPTEATIAATWADSAAGDDVTTIGRAIPGYQVHVLDADGQPVGDGEAGELCVAGPGVALGYRNLPDLTADQVRGEPVRRRTIISNRRPRESRVPTGSWSSSAGSTTRSRSAGSGSSSARSSARPPAPTRSGPRRRSCSRAVTRSGSRSCRSPGSTRSRPSRRPPGAASTCCRTT